ncbi:MAG: hypothetical protein HY903_22915 [Deltaproteobacteria bacterium]|nr:hypothetical protein [Deltaproteobacteria bacterium]
MKKLLTSTLSALLVSSLAGCGADLASTIDDQVMESALESSNDAADDAAVESGGSLSQAFGMNGGPAGALMADGCVQVATDPDPLPMPRPDSFVVNWTFTDCSWRNFVQSGTRTISFTRNTDGSRDIVGSRDVSRVRADGDSVAIDSSGSMHATGSRLDGAVDRAISFEEHRVRNDADGSLVFDVNISSSNLTIATTIAADVDIKRVFNGDILVHGNKRDYDLTTSLVGVTREPAVCCHPTAGSIHQVLSKDGETLRERTYTFGAECGQVARDDGSSVTLPACRR